MIAGTFEKRQPYELNAELDGVAYTLLGISNQCNESCDHLTDEALHEVLFAIEQHIFRISTEWMEYCEEMEKEMMRMKKERMQTETTTP